MTEVKKMSRKLNCKATLYEIAIDDRVAGTYIMCVLCNVHLGRIAEVKKQVELSNTTISENPMQKVNSMSPE